MRAKLLSLFLLFGAAPAFGALSVVQSTACVSNGVAVASQSCNFTSTPTAGNLIVVTCTSYDFNGTISLAASDNQGNSYSVDASSSQGNTDNKVIASIHHASNVSASGTFTITCTPSASDYIVMAGYEIAGASTTSTLDQIAQKTNFGAGQAQTSITSDGATTVADEIIVVSNGLATNTTPTAGTNYTLLETRVSVTANVVAFVDEYRIVSATGSQTATINYSPSISGNAMVMATYKIAGAAGGGGGATDNPRRVIISQ